MAADCTCVGGRWCEIHSTGPHCCPCDEDARPIVERNAHAIGNVYADMRGPVPGCPLHDREVG